MKNNDFVMDNDQVIIAKTGAGLMMLPIDQARRMDLLEIKQYQDFGFDQLDGKLIKDLFNHNPNGYLIKLDAGKKIKSPLDICFNISQAGFNQYAQNLIILEAGSELNINISCRAETCASEANHYSLTQIIIKSGSTLNLIMDHSWQNTNQVFPLLVAQLEDQATLNYNYRCSQSPLKIISNPSIVLNGDSSVCQMKTAIKSQVGSYNDLGANIYLNGENSRAMLDSKIVAYGGQNINNTKICATVDSAEGHLECDGLILNNQGDIVTSPTLQTINCQAELSHEASISKIKPAVLNYLACRGLDEAQAIELIVKGFFE